MNNLQELTEMLKTLEQAENQLMRVRSALSSTKQKVAVRIKSERLSVALALTVKPSKDLMVVGEIIEKLKSVNPSEFSNISAVALGRILTKQGYVKTFVGKKTYYYLELTNWVSSSPLKTGNDGR